MYKFNMSFQTVCIFTPLVVVLVLFVEVVRFSVCVNTKVKRRNVGQGLGTNRNSGYTVLSM